MRHRAAIASLAVLLPLALAGCGGDSPRRNVLQGRVTLDGEPVPAGMIFFDPDTSQGNSGPGGVAEIRDGQYQTASDFGAVSGPHLARFTLGDGVAPSTLNPYGKLLVRGQMQVTFEVPAGGGSHDFELTRPAKPK